MSRYAYPRTAWSNVVMGLPSFAEYHGGVLVEFDRMAATGAQVVLDDPDDREVRDAEDLAETMGLRSTVREGVRGTVVEVA